MHGREARGLDLRLPACPGQAGRTGSLPLPLPLPAEGGMPRSYLESGFPLKSAISKDLQNLMLSGISGMSEAERERDRPSKSRPPGKMGKRGEPRACGAGGKGGPHRSL